MGFAGLGIDMACCAINRSASNKLPQIRGHSPAQTISPFLPAAASQLGRKNASAGNGFTDGINNVTVTVNNPPTSGADSGNNKYVEVLATAVQPTYFMKVLGINSQTVTARAVATNVSGVTSGGGCLYTLGPPNSAIEGVNVIGSAVLNAPTCGINDNGDFTTAGKALTVCAGTFGAPGTADSTGGQGIDLRKQGVTCTAQAGPCPHQHAGCNRSVVQTHPLPARRAQEVRPSQSTGRVTLPERE